MMRSMIPLLAAGMSAGLAACGGGGGGGGGGSVPGGGATPASFYSTLLVIPSDTSIPVTSSVASSTVDPLGAAVTPQVTARTDATGNLQQLRLVVPELSIDTTFTGADLGTTDAIRPDLPAVQVASGTRSSGADQVSIAYVVPAASAMQYNALGFWAAEIGGTDSVGFVSVGSATLGNDIPTSGTASYSGYLAAVGTVGGTFAAVDALASATADFSARSVQFSTTSSFREDAGGARSAVPSLNVLPSTLSYAAGTNALSGTLTLQGGMSGPAKAAFYGPQAAELGGTFRVQGGGDVLQGGFGLKKN